MKIKRITDRPGLEAFFRHNLSLHLYSLGDLDDFYWPRTAYYGIEDERGISKVILIYRGAGLPVVLALGPAGFFDQALLAGMEGYLPDEFHAHLSPGVESAFTAGFSLQGFGLHYKMALDQPARLARGGEESAVRLADRDLPDALKLYEQSYPGNAFDPQMLATGWYYGCRRGGELVSIAGVHVFSTQYRVAALGNITTHPDHRNQGLGGMVTAHLCRELIREVDFVGLNVDANNQPAILLYQSLGFKIREKYGEFSLKRCH